MYFARLVLVELRKTVDVRAVQVALTTVVVALALFGFLASLQVRQTSSWGATFDLLAAVAGLTIPVLVLLGVVDELGNERVQLTLLTEPRRDLVLWAKFAAVTALGVLGFLIALGVALAVALGVGYVSRSGVQLDVERTACLGMLVAIILTVWQAFAVGVLFRSFVWGAVFLVLAPVLLPAAISLLPGLGKIGEFLNFSELTDWLIGGMGGSIPVATICLSATVWVAAPLALAWWRFRSASF